jgi:hypothetical protein
MALFSKLSAMGWADRALWLGMLVPWLGVASIPLFSFYYFFATMARLAGWLAP